MNHDLKSAPRHFAAVRARVKTFECRRNDRNYAQGDTLTLREYHDATATFTGEIEMVTVTHMLTHEDFPEAINPGFCVMSIQPARWATGPDASRHAPAGALCPGHSLRPGEARVIEVTAAVYVVEDHRGERRCIPRAQAFDRGTPFAQGTTVWLIEPGQTGPGLCRRRPGDMKYAGVSQQWTLVPLIHRHSR